MVELENLLKEGESSLSLSSNVKNETAQLTATIANYDRRHQILRHLCEVFVAEARKAAAKSASPWTFSFVTEARCCSAT